jgi:UDP-N-acetylmuramoylalanine--D-glutamate ligase
MNNILLELQNKKIHIIGVTGSEGSSILRFLIKHGVKNITTHDYVDNKDIQKSYRAWHKGIDTLEKEKLLQHFLKDLSETEFCDKKQYLKNILSADIIFVPQSWRLYKNQNQLLWQAKEKNIPFYSLTRLYLDYALAQIIGVTGTVGKGSTVHLIGQLLQNAGKKVYIAGNDTWMVQSLDRIDDMKPSDYLVLEISHRQLLDGFTKAPHIAVITNLYPNHLDELSFDDYFNTKLSMITKQTAQDIAILNYDNEIVQKHKDNFRSKIQYFSVKQIQMNTINIQNRFKEILNIKSDQYIDNILAALTVIDILHVSIQDGITQIPVILKLPARFQEIAHMNGLAIIDDVKSTTPWATIAAVTHAKTHVILICGGDMKGIDYSEFVRKMHEKVERIFCLDSELGAYLLHTQLKNKVSIYTSLFDAIKHALQMASPHDSILISPAAAFFYSKFISGKKSIKKIITSLVQAEQR